MTSSAANTIPIDHMRDRYWRGTLHLFSKQPKLRGVFTIQYFNLHYRSIKASGLKRISAPWSQSEKFMLNLALHLYNECHKVNLCDMDYLDPNNKQLAFEAIKMRFG
ncbi:hypothetical protein SAMN05518847_101854 [Paenibacillus sp. OV219]|nr:hypothetical protein SAMN05518847_101854 [Paenibacillus sp. OV219]